MRRDSRLKQQQQRDSLAGRRGRQLSRIARQAAESHRTRYSVQSRSGGAQPKSPCLFGWRFLHLWEYEYTSLLRASCDPPA